MFSLRGSLITLAVFTVLSLAYFSLNFSVSSPPLPSPSPSPSVTATIDLPVIRQEETFDSNPSPEEEEEFLDIYHSPEVFRLNYAEMERKFKVYIYPDGDPNTFYQTPRKLTGKYSSEGYFFQNIRKRRFRTEDPDQAQLFFIPISCHKMRGKGTSYENMTIIVQNYVESF
ncbi:probable glycosyltransferase At5g03795 [Rosa rugosa]|uniref:probable glycosyltransferase At5g03795 n=1 Tax=Rosa rugosa TaxID=74645 RepID=UPI002B40DBB6|nr:probable glycosyltransferase At5g03795 [Rosa rugosa]